MNRYWNARTQQLSPYVPGEQPQDRNYIKLNTNENPYPPSAKVRQAIHDAVDSGLQLYPDPNCVELKKVIANTCQCSADNVFVGNGSDEVLAHIFAGLFAPDQALWMPDISYSFYPVYAKLYGLKTQLVPLDEAFQIDLSQFENSNGGVIFANPNAPTSVVQPLAQIEAFLQRNTDSVVVVDEAYIDFGGESCVPLISTYPNLIVTQTLSKSRSLAGMRIGFALANAELIEGLERIKNSFNSYPLDKLALAAAVAAFEDVEAFTKGVESIVKTRTWATTQLQALGATVLPSSTNFLFVRPNFAEAKAAYLSLKQQGILVRHFNQARLSDFLRITIGTPLEMDALIAAIAMDKANS